MTDSKNARLIGVVTGSVQGVSFRAFTQKRAMELGLVGYVRNRSDSAVEFVAEGARTDLERLLDAVRVGPWMAVVENVDARWSRCTDEFRRFEIRY